MKIKTISARRRKGLEFHIQSDDYFGSLATALFLLQDVLDEPGIKDAKKALQRTVWDLMFLQENCRVVCK